MTISPGTRLGPYEIVTLLGAGGMGQVWKAIDKRLDRTIAIKICGEQFTDRFEREARAIAALNHPRICTLYDVGPNYLVMELLEGETLAIRLKRGKLALEQTLEYGQQIADALAAAHAKGIVHRDLKPETSCLQLPASRCWTLGWRGRNRTKRSPLHKPYWAPLRTCRRSSVKEENAAAARISMRLAWCCAKWPQADATRHLPRFLRNSCTSWSDASPPNRTIDGNPLGTFAPNWSG